MGDENYIFRRKKGVIILELIPFHSYGLFKEIQFWVIHINDLVPDYNLVWHKEIKFQNRGYKKKKRWKQYLVTGSRQVQTQLQLILDFFTKSKICLTVSNNPFSKENLFTSWEVFYIFKLISFVPFYIYSSITFFQFKWKYFISFHNFCHQYFCKKICIFAYSKSNRSYYASKDTVFYKTF